MINFSLERLKKAKLVFLNASSTARVLLEEKDDKGNFSQRPLKYDNKTDGVEEDDRLVETLGSWSRTDSADIAISIGSTLEDKPFALFGIQNSTSRDRAKAIARLFGLNFRVGTMGAVISSSYPAPPQILADVPAYFPACLPLVLKQSLMTAREPDLISRCESILYRAGKRLATEENKGTVGFTELNGLLA